MKKNIAAFTETEALLEAKYGKNLTDKIMKLSMGEFRKLCAENPNESKAVKAHTVEKIYPCISIYKSMQQAGISSAEALEFLDYSHSKRAEKSAASIRAMLKLPGLYRLMPSIFRWVTVHHFGTDAGFRANFYPTDKSKVKFDMTKCLYCDVCRKNGYPELIPCFCHTDDVTNGNMHKKLCWHRTKIMGDGAELCDFELYIKDEK